MLKITKKAILIVLAVLLVIFAASSICFETDPQNTNIDSSPSNAQNENGELKIQNKG